LRSGCCPAVPRQGRPGVATASRFQPGPWAVTSGHWVKFPWFVMSCKKCLQTVAPTLPMATCSAGMLSNSQVHVAAFCPAPAASSPHRIRSFCTNCVVLVSRQSDGGQNTDDRNYDHQFDQGKTLLLLVDVFHFYLLKKHVDHACYLYSNLGMDSRQGRCENCKEHATKRSLQSMMTQYDPAHFFPAQPAVFLQSWC
jgi:hypothetical protein